MPERSPRVHVGGLLRNGEAAVPEIVAFVDALTRELPRLDAYVFENNSEDGTAEALAHWAQQRPYFHVSSEVWDLDEFRERSKARTWDNKPCRLELISTARNRLLDWIREAGLTSADRVVIVDWDFGAPPPVGPLAKHVLEMPAEADALFANGVDRRGRYYDLYELRTHEYPLGPELLGDRFWSSRRRRRALARVISPDEPPIECYSAFGGLAIYRGDAFGDCRYSAYPTPELHAFYKERFETDPRNAEVRSVRRRKVAKIRSGGLMGANLFDDELFYLNNSGFNFPIAAEHVNLHIAMRAHGGRRLFIAPSLPYFSHH
jgi:hypothetical protein